MLINFTECNKMILLQLVQMPWPVSITRVRGSQIQNVGAWMLKVVLPKITEMSEFLEVRNRNFAHPCCGIDVNGEGEDFVVVPKRLDEAITERCLPDTTLYHANLRLPLISRLKIGVPVCSVLYILAH